ncbi:MAG: D-alanine--D-alanine ligase [Planctomycetes bacterium]|nr:D-alanine--D-alanine ligase [Planctomycetota bacterium]
MNVLVLKGGPDAEREVSLRSGGMVAAALRRAGAVVHEQTIDRPGLEELRAMPGEVVFPVLHGPWGEGGVLQDILERDGRPYVGCAPAAARLAMDKPASKRAVAAVGVPTPDSQVLQAADRLTLSPPLVLKPCDDGSSVDLRVCGTVADAERARAELHPRRPVLLAESFIAGRELTIGLLEDRELPLIEVRPKCGLYDYEAKYNRDDTEYRLDPELPAGVADSIRRWARAAWTRLGLRDVARMDFMLDARGAWFLEANTMPGFTDHSLVPKAAAHAGLPMERLVIVLAERAMARGGAAVRA